MYYPKNKIQTNKTTLGGEFVYKITKKPYSGFYWVNSENKYFTGRNPNDKPSNELLKIPQTQNQPIDGSSQIIGIHSPTINFENKSFKYSPNLVSKYIQLKNVNLEPKNTPSPYYPEPNPQDYSKGEFIRFFLKLINQNVYYEVNKKTYDAINNNRSDWDWERYVYFSIKWKISGEENKVMEFNQKEVINIEKQFKGFSSFLNHNFLKYYK